MKAHCSFPNWKELAVALDYGSALLVPSTLDQTCQLKRGVSLYAVKLVLWSFPVCQLVCLLLFFS